MRTYITTISRALCCLSLVTLVGCFSGGATPPGANTSCTTDDSCPTGYKCDQATTGAIGKFCCKDAKNCGPAVGSGGSGGRTLDGPGLASGGAIGADGPSSKGGSDAGASSGGAGGSSVGDGGIGGAGGGAGGSGVGEGGNGGIGGGAGGSSGGISAGRDAAPDAPTLVPDAPVLLSPGAACSVDSDCALNYCVDGVCCDKACTGCNACKNSQTGVNDGTCAFASLGLNPHKTCVDETATNACGNDGTCDGKGACHKVSNSKVCTAASCSGSTFNPAATCDGAGACKPSTPEDCGLFQCATTGCLKKCTTDTDCGTTNYCSAAGTCAAKLANGMAATAGSQCTFGVVADGVCCDKACVGCYACTSALNGQAASTTGQCLPVMIGKAGHGTCTAAPPCGLDGMCDGNGACHYTPAATSCAPDSCSGSTLKTSACDGVAHTCVATSNACKGALVCASATGCKTTCTADSDCVTGDYCASGTCTTKLDNGATCGGSSQCKNGNCVEGVCCDGVCGQTCRSCLASKTGGKDGTCANMTPGSACTGGVCNSTTSTTPACVACVQGASCPPTNVCKTGKLDCSTGAAVCKEDQNLDSTHACGPAASCSTTTKKATHAQMCSAGTCPAAIVDDCGAYGCNGTVCATTKPQGTACASTAECATGLSCADGYCCNSTCTGSCQACNVSGHLGTCTTLGSGSTPFTGHPPCVASDATCAGYCNGTSASCTYPSTTCGTSTCSGQIYQATGTCNNGACAKPNPQTCSSCLAGTGCVACTPTAKQCSSSGVPQVCSSSGTWQNGTACSGCATCSAGACVAGSGSCSSPPTCRGLGTCTVVSGVGTCSYPIASGGQCSNGNGCITGETCQSNGTCGGGSSKVCSSPCHNNGGCSGGNCLAGTQKNGVQDLSCQSIGAPGNWCNAGNCVECFQDSNCPSSSPVCDISTHTCQCRRPSAGNVVPNPGFNDMSYWTAGNSIWSTTDVDGCPGSGSVGGINLSSSPYQCFPVSRSTYYYFGGVFNVQNVNNTARCTLVYYGPGTICTPDNETGVPIFIGPQGSNSSTGWLRYKVDASSTPDSDAASIECEMGNAHVDIDQLYLNPNGTF
jgi:hypothetical protein